MILGVFLTASLDFRAGSGTVFPTEHIVHIPGFVRRGYFFRCHAKCGALPSAVRFYCVLRGAQEDSYVSKLLHGCFLYDSDRRFCSMSYSGYLQQLVAIIIVQTSELAREKTN